VPVEDVDARKDRNKNDKAEAPDPDDVKPIYKPK